MQLVVADTGPVNYLLLIGYIDLLPQLFQKISMPSAVRDELAHPKAPPLVRGWIAHPPGWLDVVSSPSSVDPSLLPLDEGERAAISLAVSLHADLILMDDREGVSLARKRGFAVIGTLGILDLASRRGIVDLNTALTRLKATNFRYPPDILNRLFFSPK